MKTKLTLIVVLLLALGAVAVVAQKAMNAASASENARLKTLIATEKKALDAYNAKLATLPETKALKDAQDAFNKAVEGLPETEARKAASAEVLREAHRIMAEHKLSAMEYKPQLNDKGDLEFVPLKTP